MKTAPQLTILAALVALTIVGCSSDDNPVAPPVETPSPPAEINTP